MSRRPVYTPPPKPPKPRKPLVKKRYRAQLSVTCYLDVELWATDEPEARLAAHNTACPANPSVTAHIISEPKMALCRECAENGFQLGRDWNVDTVEEIEK
jgi:hypothetical protein